MKFCHQVLKLNFSFLVLKEYIDMISDNLLYLA